MHRQSLGSPGSKLLSHGVIGAKEDNIVADDQKLPNSLAVEEKDKLEKPNKSLQRGEKIVHIIPILILLCFLILYLSSHSPSQIDLAQFSGFEPFSKLKDSSEIDDFGRLLEIEKDDVLAIRSLRNLQEIGSHRPAKRLHRKIGDF